MTLETRHGVDLREGNTEGFFTLPLGAEEMAEHFVNSMGADWTKLAWHRFLTRVADADYRWIILRADPEQENYSEKYRVSVKFANDILPTSSRNSPIERAMEMLNVDLYWAGIGKPQKVRGNVNPAPLALAGTSIETHQALVVAMPEFFSTESQQGRRPSVFAIGRMF